MSDQTFMEYIDPKKLRRDVNQPRQPDWDSDEVQAELQKLADSYHGDPENQIWQLKIDENDTVRLGERRWRAALLANLPIMKIERIKGLSNLEWFRLQMEDDEYKVLHTEIDKAWAYGLRIVRINTGDDSISLKDIKEMDQVEIVNLLSRMKGAKKPGTDEQLEGGVGRLAREIGVDQKYIWNYIQVLYLEPETQAMIGKKEGQIPFSYARIVTRLLPDHIEEKKEMERLLRIGVFAKNVDLLIEICASINKLHTEDIKHEAMIDQIIELVESGTITKAEKLEAYVDEYLENYQEIVKARTKELEAEIQEPVVEPPEAEEEEEPEEPPAPPEPPQEAVETEAERLVRETNEAKDKVFNSLYVEHGKGNSLEGKIVSATKLEVNEEFVSKWKEQFTNFDSTIKEANLSKSEYEDHYTNIRDVIADINAKKKERQTEINRQKIEEDEKKRIREEVKDELRADATFIDTVSEEMQKKQIAEFSEVVGDLPEPLTEEELEEFEKAQQEYYDNLERLSSSEVVRKRGKLFRNWWNHASILGVVSALACPNCDSPSGNLHWNCCNISYQDTIEIARKQYEESVGNKKWPEKDP